MNDEEKTTAWWSAFIFGAVFGVIGSSLIWALARPDKPALPDKLEAKAPTQWIGRLVAGDGQSKLFTAPVIEIGLRQDGTMIWRATAPPAPIPPMPLLTQPTNAPQ